MGGSFAIFSTLASALSCSAWWHNDNWLHVMCWCVFCTSEDNGSKNEWPDNDCVLMTRMLSCTHKPRRHLADVALSATAWPANPSICSANYLPNTSEWQEATYTALFPVNIRSNVSPLWALFRFISAQQRLFPPDWFRQDEPLICAAHILQRQNDIIQITW